MILLITPQCITANKRNCLTMLCLDNYIMNFGSIRLFANRYGQLKKQNRDERKTKTNFYLE